MYTLSHTFYMFWKTSFNKYHVQDLRQFLQYCQIYAEPGNYAAKNFSNSINLKFKYIVNLPLYSIVNLIRINR